MWRFLNSIPRAFRQQFHGPRASVGVHVEDGEQECQINQEIGTQGKQDVKEYHVKRSDAIDTPTICGATEETVVHKRRTSLVRRVFLGWNPRHEGFFSHYTNQGERTDQEKEEQWWKACRHDLCNLLNRNHLLEILTLGSCYGLRSDDEKNAARKNLLYRVLFSLSNGRSSLYVSGNKLPARLSVPLPDEKHQDKPVQVNTSVLQTGSTQINADSDSESIDSALNEFQDICQEYSSKSESLLGLEAAKNGEMSLALEHLKNACAMGNSSACFNVGLCYETGCGVKKDIDKAVEYYEKAARHGHSLAMYNLGLIYLSNEKDSVQQQGILFIEKAARLGLVEAQTQMGILCMDQDNANDAYVYFKAAADQNDCEAQYFLALCYEEGLGVDVDLEISAQMYSVAADAGHEEALAALSEQGMGGFVAHPPATFDQYQKAADADHSYTESLSGNSSAEEADTENKHQVLEEKTHLRQHDNTNSSDVSLRRSSTGSQSLSTSASSPNLISQYTDITSLFYPEATSGKAGLFSFHSGHEKQSQRRSSGGFYIGEADDDFRLEQNNIRWSWTLKNDNSSNGKDFTHAEFSYPKYGHFPKSHTSPNLAAVVACNI